MNVWPELVLLDKDALRALPECKDVPMNIAGVYFLWSFRELVYVGSSVNLRQRQSSHRSGTIYFDRMTCQVVDWPWFAALELAYIDRYRPRKNFNHNSKTARELLRAHRHAIQRQKREEFTTPVQFSPADLSADYVAGVE